MIYRDGKKIDASKGSEDGDESENSGLISKGLVPEGAKVGDTVVFKIKHAFDDEYEIEYSSSKKSKADDNVTEEPVSDEMEAADKQLDEMATAPEA